MSKSSSRLSLLGRASALALASWLALGTNAGADDVAPASAPAATPDAARRAEIVRVVEELRVEASKIRGLAWKQPVPADLLSREQLKAQLEDMIKEDFKPDEYARDLKILRRLGLLTAEEDPLEMTKRFLEQGIAGFYNPKTKRLYIIDGLSVEAQRPTMLHELVHALEDQYIDLEARQKAVEKDGDRLFALKCTIEGSAERARAIYEKAHPDIAKLSQQEQSKGQNMEELGRILKSTPAFLFVPSLLHYQMGPALVTRYVGADYPGGIAKMYAGDAPTTSEQCVHPGRFVTDHRDLPRGIEWPGQLADAAGPGWKGLEAQPTGELDFVLWMSHWLGKNQGRLSMADASTGRMWARDAGVAGEGWDGMKTQVFEKDGVPTGVALASAWDSHKDAVEAGDAIETALRGQFGDAFETAGWHDGEGGKGRALDFTDRFGTGRLLVRDDVVLLLDGFEKTTFPAVWAMLDSTKFTRDPADTWSPEAGGSPLAKATWKAGDVGWNPPDEMWIQGEDASTFTKGDLELNLSTTKGPIQMTVLKTLVAIRRASPRTKIDPSTIAELKVGAKQALRLDYESPGSKEGDEPTANALFFVIDEQATIVVRASGPKAAWAKLAPDVDAALEGFVFKD